MLENLGLSISGSAKDATGGTLARPTIPHLRSLMDAIPDPVIITDGDGQIKFVNPAVESFFGYSRDQLIGQNVDILVPNNVRGRHEAHRAAYMAEPKLRSMGAGLDLRAVRADGTEFPVAVSLGFADTESGRMVIATIQDRSELHRRDRSIKQLNERLKRDNAALDAANKELEAFSYSVSHDLRTPLRTIDGFSHALQEDCGDQLDEAGQGYLNRIRQAAQRMGGLIDDLIELSRISRADLRRERVDLSALAREIADALKASAPEREVEFNIADRVEAQCDAHLLRIALDNLLNNAWKYSVDRSPARIEFGQKHVDGDTAYYVRDNGAGFDMAYASKLFAAFQRLHHDREFPGTGIGLATVQRIINKHGGRIWAQAELGKGAIFSFTL